MLNMNKIRVGVVGVGHLGSRHAKIYKEISGCTLAGVCDTDRARLSEISQSLMVPGYGDYRELFGRVDAVSIATPTRLHYRIAADFLKHKVHTLVEKPFTASIKEADALIRLAQKNKLILAVGHIERFNSAFSATRKLISNPKFIECHRLSPFPNRSLDVGAVLDIMIHDIDIVLGLVDSAVRKIESVGIPVLTRLEDIANARITFKNGCVANLTASRVSDEVMRKIRIFQKNTYISLDYKDAKATLYRKDSRGISKEDLPIEKEQPLQKELESFLNCSAEHKEPLVSGKVARDALALALKIQNQIWQKKRRS
ncbi:MAG: Gfo/Idh/MocA family oxidoreductase [Candidatus Omnitrophica bacterium]|nr:Gfo/Idh/MocA family oxidoreductase [Candidatus Omnitrophota bacterium]MBL7210348.1 Gfo/Idh/MocA family oxidoreductase [Candidatus Omnitrophota bacterium]